MSSGKNSALPLRSLCVSAVELSDNPPPQDAESAVEAQRSRRFLLLIAQSNSLHGDQNVIRKVTIFVVLLLGLVIQASAQQQALIGNPAGRNATSLNGNWQIIIDPYETGYYDYRYQPRPDGYFKNQKPATPGDLVEYDFDSSQQLLVPGDWNSQDDKLLFYEGTIWYKKSFNYQKKEHSRLFVYF